MGWVTISTLCVPAEPGKIYVITVTFYGQPPSEFILKPPKSQVVTILFSGGIDALVQVRIRADPVCGESPWPCMQIFFGNRIRVLSGRLHILFLCIALAILRFTCGIILTSTYWVNEVGYSEVNVKDYWEVVASEAITPAGDGIIALSMCYYLWRVRDSEFNRCVRRAY